jgi:plastocyanin
MSVLAIGLVAVLAGCGANGDEAAAPDEPGAAIEISETEFRLSPADVRIDQAGTYTFRAVNEGATTHALALEGEGVVAATEGIAPGATADLTVELEAGSYRLYCPIGNHRAEGMEASLVVAGGGTGGGSGGPYGY